MPRVKSLGKAVVNPVKQREVFNRLIRVAMARKDIRHNAQLASMIAMDDSCLSKRMSGDSKWSYEELCRLFRVLEFTPEETAQAMGVAVA
ncbi:MAG: hypothetical protein IJ396_05560 [Oscillibacter sp.]|nr:hypothetical protein [Oscillibacter sp.]